MSRELVKDHLERPGLEPGVCMVHTDPPVMVYTQMFALYEHVRRHVLHRGGGPALDKASIPAVRVLDFTCIFGVVFYNRGDHSGF